MSLVCSEDICLQTLTSFSLARKITGACGWQKLFRAGQILYSQTNFQRDIRQVSILGFPLNFVSEALSWYSNFRPGFRMKCSIYVKRQANFQSFLLFRSLFANHKYCVTVLVTSLISSLFDRYKTSLALRSDNYLKTNGSSPFHK